MVIFVHMTTINDRVDFIFVVYQKNITGKFAELETETFDLYQNNFVQERFV